MMTGRTTAFTAGVKLKPPLSSLGSLMGAKSPLRKLRAAMAILPCRIYSPGKKERKKPGLLS
jgi:hypothetical protein